ncbi:MAG: hypothetical protein WA942_05875 [Mycolicibacter sinensis]
MTTDNPDARSITGDVIPDSIRRVSGTPGGDGVIEMALFGFPCRYRIRIDRSGPAPRLAELHVIADDDTDISSTTIRQVPVRRLTLAAARFVGLTEHSVAVAGEFDDPTGLIRPDHQPGRGKYDDVHYRQVANLLTAAREMGLPAREYVAERLGPVSLPTVSRWLAEAKRRGFLRRDWATTSTKEN